MKTRKVNGKMSKSEFIRSKPLTMPAADVVAAGKKEGLTIRPGAVHTVRHHAKVNGLMGPKSKAKPKTVRVKKAKGRTMAVGDDVMSELTAFGLSLKDYVRAQVREEMRRIMGAVNA